MYTASGTLDRDQLAKHYAPLVKRIAYHLMAKLPASVQVEDIIQNGMLGLLDAMSRYEEGLGRAVRNLRRAAHPWRHARRPARERLAAAQPAPRHAPHRNGHPTLEQQKGRQPTEGELADSLGMPLGEYQKMLQEARGYQLVYFEDFTDGDDDDYLDRHSVGTADLDPLARLLDKNMRDVLVRAIGDLPDREKTVMGLYYEEDLNLREIGEILGVSESRVCQLHSQAIARLRSRIAARG
jgi:RNA polymerase sigma factor for flagellar operon FliA